MHLVIELRHRTIPYIRAKEEEYKEALAVIQQQIKAKLGWEVAGGIEKDEEDDEDR